jgi:hypothetical protein
MDTLRFAICIMAPDTPMEDLVNAATRHGVHILDKIVIDPSKPRFIPPGRLAALQPDVSAICLLPGKEPVFIEDTADLNAVIKGYWEIS